MNFQILIAFSVYFCILITIGLIASKKQDNTASFFLGNRNLNYFVAAISANTSDMSVWIFMGLPMSIYLGGIINSWTAIGLIVFMFLNWHIVAPRLRMDTEKYNALTLFTYFERRLNDKSGIIRLVSAVWSLIFLTFYISIGLVGIGFLFELIFNINYYLGCILAILAVIIYTLVGGFTAIAITDFFQGIFLLLVLFFVPFLALSKIGGFAGLEEAFLKKNISLSMIPDFSDSTFKKIANSSIGWGLGYFGQPHILNKFMAIKNPNDIKKSKLISMIWQIIALFSSSFIGLIAIVYLKETPANTQLIFVEIVKTLFNPFLSGIILCAILAAILSTIDSQILVLSSVIAEDIYKRIINKKASNNKIMQISRFSIIGISLVTLIISFFSQKNIFELVKYCWIGLGCAFGPLVIMCLYSKTINKYGALSGMIVGGSIASIWSCFNLQISATIPAFLAGLIIIFSVSNLIKKNV